MEEKLIKIEAQVVNRGRYVAFRMAEITFPNYPFYLRLIAELRQQPDPASA